MQFTIFFSLIAASLLNQVVAVPVNPPVPIATTEPVTPILHPLGGTQGFTPAPVNTQGTEPIPSQGIGRVLP
ncbi:hypothetical protein Clacol_005811 [Clathrus columnatus]|uniref:Uncharacterized protein n=1 Tax=Clathrus columnatus TaxID=1419009 RepID=A0AAV5AF28_9AGAM|nr:hypothetical protein Clacol_005811 [Clathrus columnatus]